LLKLRKHRNRRRRRSGDPDCRGRPRPRGRRHLRKNFAKRLSGGRKRRGPIAPLTVVRPHPQRVNTSAGDVIELTELRRRDVDLLIGGLRIPVDGEMRAALFLLTVNRSVAGIIVPDATVCAASVGVTVGGVAPGSVSAASAMLLHFPSKARSHT
jgi:hypothetical protein